MAQYLVVLEVVTKSRGQYTAEQLLACEPSALPDELGLLKVRFGGRVQDLLNEEPRVSVRQIVPLVER